MRRLCFDKYEGLGNDFVVVEATDADALSPSRVSALCDRHFGIGGDGVLLVLPASSPSARARMIVINADGSRPEMCGNGLRCVALHLARVDAADRVDYDVETDAGVLPCRVEREGDEAWVSTVLGHAELLGSYCHPGAKTYEFTRISVGNPHAVIFGAGCAPELVDEVGAQVCAAIHGGANVEFVEQHGPTQLRVVVWERGVGRTLACGTGAAAVAVAATSSGRSPFDTPIELVLPGGPLQAVVEAGTLRVTLRGPARRVFSGEARLP